MFIVLEGLDGAGKSTQIKLLTAMLVERGMEVEYLHFPRFDAPVYGDMIARFLRGEFGTAEQVNPYLVALLYAGDRADAAAMINGWREQGKCVIVDRYVLSNIGYQCAKVSGEEARKELREWILDVEFNKFAIPRPDVSLFLDVPFEFTKKKLSEVREGDDREYLKGGKDIHEASLDLQLCVRESYLQYAKEYGDLKIVDCCDDNGNMADAQTIFGRIEKELSPYL